MEVELIDSGFILSEGEDVEVVVQGIDRQFTYKKLAKAIQSIHSGAEFIITNPDHLLPSDDRLIPGAGSIAAAIQTASKTEPIIIGKPSPIIIQYAIERLIQKAPDLKREQIWVIGDNMQTDIQAGILAHLPTALVLTGISKNIGLVHSRVQPTLVAKDLEDLAHQIF
ncbi:HAD hydrolase-like protein [Tepidibacillus marianensis]|uniref:HAD-IIA family hydrolase n=1 Tax=Tepidibacillus marianensis TaxID=3131995 RepID=UPI0030CEB3DE